MDMNLEVVLSNCTIHIELLDIPIIRHWYLHYKNQEYSNYAYCFNMVNHTMIQTKEQKDLVYNNINEIIQTKNELEKLNYIWPECIPIPNLDDQLFNQSMLNKLHRFFTNNWRWYIDRGQKNDGAPNPYDPSFILPDSCEWIPLIDRINQAVHNLEHYVTPEYTKQYILDNNLEINVLHIKSFLDKRINFTIEEYQHNYNFDLDDDSYPVVLPNEILGKCVLLSFSDNDDPTEVDVWGRQQAQVDFYIDLNKNRRKIYKSNMFKEWAQGYNRSIDSLPLDFMIGKVKNLPLPPEEFYKNDYQLLAINFV